jgi:hypothetical protein
VTSPCFDLTKKSSRAAALRDLRGFWKLWSSCLLTDFRLPSLRGLYLTKPYATINDDVGNFLSHIDSKIVLLRQDKFPESPPYPRGGFLVSQKTLDETLEYFFSLDRIVALYEPADPLLNGHNLNVLFENDHEVRVEVVGPGFDMSDIKRGDLSPHESFLVYLDANGEISEVKLLYRMDAPTFMKSLGERMLKIREKLYSAPEVSLSCKIRKDLGVSENLDAHLKEIGSPLYNLKYYPPISENALLGTIDKIVESNVIKAYSTLTGARFPFVFSTSFVSMGRRQVFWDIVSPALKFQGLR